jgi:hypothetical protein
MRRILFAALIAAASLGGIQNATATTSIGEQRCEVGNAAQCLEELLNSTSTCSGGVQICANSTSCDGAVNVCGNAQSCTGGGVNVCGNATTCSGLVNY